VSGVLRNSDRLTNNLANGTQDLEAIIAEVKVILTQTKLATAKINTLVENSNSLIEGDAKKLVAEAVTTMQTATTLLARVDNMVAANEGAVTQFVNTSLPEVSRMILDLRVTARNLSRLMSRIEQNPAEIIFGTKEAEYDLKKRRTVKDDN
jgi:phospholipid/cholesterol/gamma-HCH transport system substrate-binding protein